MDGLRIRDPREYIELQSQRARVVTRWSAMHVWLHSTTLLRHFTMRRRTSTHSSHMAKPDEQLPRYGLRKRTAHHLALDDESREDTFRGQSPPKRPKRTTTFTYAQSPSSRVPARKRMKEGQGRRHTRKDEGKAWSAEAVLEKTDVQ